MRAEFSPRLFNSYPLTVAAACLACGIVFLHLFTPPLLVCFFIGVLAMCVAAISFRRDRLILASLFIAVSLTSAGAMLATLEKGRIEEDRVRRMYDDGVIVSGDPVEITGVVERMPEPAPDGFFFTLRAQSLRAGETARDASGNVRLFAPVRDRATLARYQDFELRHGARLRVMVALHRAESFRNPGGASFTEYLERRGLDGVGTIKSPLLIERLNDERVFLPLVWLYEQRARMMADIGRMFSTQTAGVLNATLLGNRYGLSRATSDRFREGGTFHVIVVSGLHITFIGGMVLLIARRVTRRRAWQFALVVVFIWSYALAVGAESSVVRAALMFTIAAMGPLLYRSTNALNALGAACLVLLVWRPSDLFDPSFQLTFLSVLAITAIAWPLVARLREVGEWRPTRDTPYPPACPRWWRTLGETLFWSERRWRREMEAALYDYRLTKSPIAARLERFRLQRIVRYIFAALIVSLSVQLFLLPFSVIYFHRFSLAGLVLNIWVGALMALLCLLALAALIVAQMSGMLAAPLISLAEATNWLMTHSVDPFSWIDAAQVRLPEYTNWSSIVYGLYYLPILVLLVALAWWKPLRLPMSSTDNGQRLPRFAVRASAFASFALFIVILAHPGSARSEAGRLRVDFIDVGQGDSALVTMPDGRTLLIDGGGRAEAGSSFEDDDDKEVFERDRRSIGEAVVSEYLWWRGLDHVDYILATHADTDHIDGLNDVARNFRVRTALVARTPPDDVEYRRFASSLARARVPLQILGSGDTLRFGEVMIDVLWPPRTMRLEASSNNNDSIVLRLRFGEQTIMFTGDVESTTENALVSANNDLRCDVVKVAHHGSRTSSIQLFVAATQPALAVISVADPSPYNHPHREVVERWQASGAEILTTAQTGMISISTDGRDRRVETFVPRHTEP